MDRTRIDPQIVLLVLDVVVQLHHINERLSDTYDNYTWVNSSVSYTFAHSIQYYPRPLVHPFLFYNGSVVSDLTFVYSLQENGSLDWDKFSYNNSPIVDVMRILTTYVNGSAYGNIYLEKFCVTTEDGTMYCEGD